MKSGTVRGGRSAPDVSQLVSQNRSDLFTAEFRYPAFLTTMSDRGKSSQSCPAKLVRGFVPSRLGWRWRLEGRTRPISVGARVPRSQRHAEPNFSRLTDQLGIGRGGRRRRFAQICANSVRHG